MEQIAEMIKNLQLKLDEQSKEIREMKESIPECINKKLDEKFLVLESRQLELEKTTQKQQHQIQQLEQVLRRKNLVFFGISETERNYFELQNIIIELINNDMRVICGKQDLEYVRRLGKKTDKIRPVIVTLSTYGKKIELLKNKRTLIKTNYYIKEDLSPEIREERKKLNSQVQEERKKGNKAYIKYNKIIIVTDNEKAQYNQNDRQKRNLSNSPETPPLLSSLHKPNTTNPLKKNRMELSQYLIQKKNKNIHATETSFNDNK